jgi:pimeloyl-ACP methyl ester carboxylesterase
MCVILDSARIRVKQAVPARRFDSCSWARSCIVLLFVGKVTFQSGGVQLAGALHRPVNGPGPAPGLVVCHGFGGNSAGAGYRILAQSLAEAGYVVLRFDFRGCGASGGEPGRVIFEEEVEDLEAAVTFLAAQPGVDAGRIAAIGASMGGSVVIYGAAADARIRACVASGAVANGERFCRWQHRDDTGWERYVARLEEARQYRKATGRSRIMNRFEIVFIPEQMRQGLPPGSCMEFPAETAISMLGFKHILAGNNHFAFGEPEVVHIIRSWLARHLPAPG